MAVVYEFRCDACGERGSGVAGDYLHPDPPLGWVWRFGSSLEGPHACSRVCWDKVKMTPEGKIILHMDHEKLEERRSVQPTPPMPPSCMDRIERHAPRPASYVYFAQRGEDGPIKIGVSKNPISRVKELGTASAEGLRLLGVIPGTRRAEIEIHTLFSGCRLNGEWFRSAPDLIAYVSAHARPFGAWKDGI